MICKGDSQHIPEFTRLCNQLWKEASMTRSRYSSSSPTPWKILHFPFRSPEPLGSEVDDSFLDPSLRTCIIHFPGSSFNKNTLQNVTAGLALLDKHPDILTKLIVKIGKWPKKGNLNLSIMYIFKSSDVSCLACLI